MTTMTGGCLCGAVRYEVSAPMLFGGFCYCADCRKSSGSAYSASMAFPEAGVKLTGETRSFSCIGDSGNPVTRVFCPNCGSGIMSKGARAGVVIVRAGTLDEPDHFKPMASIYAVSAPAWDKPRDGLPVFERMPPQ